MICEKIQIKLSRYEELLEKETKLKILENYLLSDKYMSSETALSIIGSKRTKMSDNKSQEDK